MIEHTGSACPVPSGTIVRVDLGDGEVYAGPADEWHWGPGLGADGEGRILRYEVLLSAGSKPSNPKDIVGVKPIRARTTETGDDAPGIKPTNPKDAIGRLYIDPRLDPMESARRTMPRFDSAALARAERRLNVRLPKGEKQMILPADPTERKGIPITTGVIDYFPLALAEVARVSKAGNDQHNPGQPLHWAKEKSTDHADCIPRHLIDRYSRDADGQRHAAKMAWRSLAFLETLLEDEAKGAAA